MRPALAATLFLALAGTSAPLPAPSPSEDAPSPEGAREAPARLQLDPCDRPGTSSSMLCGAHEVFEDREARRGRRISLQVVVIPADSEARKPDPIFLLAGGPGQAATRLAGWVKRSWMHDGSRDLVLVDQRGTGGSNRLDCDLSAGGDDPLSALDSFFRNPGLFRECLQDLERHADPRLYTTPAAMDDLDEIRRALGYGRINLVGGSYGSRAALVYIRRHGESVRAAVLWGPAPLAQTLPLYHARDAQRALDLLFDQCADEPACRSAYPDPRGELAGILSRLEREPVQVALQEPGERMPHTVHLTREAFAEALRIHMYTTSGGRRIPRLLHEAHGGDYSGFVRSSLRLVGGMLDQIDLGMSISVVCSEDVPRIDEGKIPEVTRGTFIGDARLRAQIELCRSWARGSIPDSYGDPVGGEMPVLVISGELDPVTPPSWGEELVRHFPRGRHLPVPRAHDVNTPCVGEIASAFLHGDPVTPLDRSCVDEMELPPFELPD